MLDIVIVNWNAGKQLAECVSSIVENGGGMVSGIVVVDNGSTDGSEAAVEGVPLVDLVCTGQNLGFGRACNLGAQRGTAEYLLFLNPDSRVLPDTLQTSVGFMRSGAAKGVGICGVQLIDDNNRVSRSCSRFPTARTVLARATGLDRAILRWGSRMSEWDHSECRRVDQVIGAYFLMRRDLFEAHGGFDERFFVYYEEVDLARRCADAGWASWYLATTQAYHKGGGTSHQVKAHRLFYSLRSRLQYAQKHFSWAGLVAVWIATLLIEPVTRGVRAVAQRDFSQLREISQAYSWLLSWMSSRRTGI